MNKLLEKLKGKAAASPLRPAWRPIAIGAVLLLVLAGAAALTLGRVRTHSVVWADGYFITEDVAPALRRGLSEEDEEMRVELLGARAQDVVYSRLGSYFVGSDMTEVEAAYPQYLAGTTGVRFLDAETVLLAEDLETRTPTYDGLRLNGGVTFAEDGMQAHVENYILAQLPNSLYMTAQDMLLRVQGRTITVPSTSLASFAETALTAYVHVDGTLEYREYADLEEATVTFGGLTLPYADFYDWLTGGGDGVPGVDKPVNPLEWPSGSQTPVPILPVEGEPSLKPDDDTEPTGGDDENADATHGDSGENVPLEHVPTPPNWFIAPQYSPNQFIPAPPSTMPAGTSPYNSWALPRVYVKDVYTTAYTVECDITVEDKYGKLNKVLFEVLWDGKLQLSRSVRRTALSEDGYYHASISLAPPDTTVELRVTYAYTAANGEKVTDVQVYTNSNLKTMSIEEALDAGMMARIPVQLTGQAMTELERYTDRVALPGMSLSAPAEGNNPGVPAPQPNLRPDPNPDPDDKNPGKIDITPTPQQAMETTLDTYMSSVNVVLTRQGGLVQDSFTLPLAPTELAALRSGNLLQYISSDDPTTSGLFRSDSVYDYTIQLRDKFGNDLPLVLVNELGQPVDLAGNVLAAGDAPVIDGDVRALLAGEVQTIKKLPRISIALNEEASSYNSIGTKVLTLRMENPDAAPLLNLSQALADGSTVDRCLWLEVLRVPAGGAAVGQPLSPTANAHLDGSDGAQLYDNWIKLDPAKLLAGELEIAINELPAGENMSYEFRVYANVDRTTKNGDPSLIDQEFTVTVGSLVTPSLALSDLASFQTVQSAYNITDTTASVRTWAAVSDDLLWPNLTRFQLELGKGTSGSIREPVPQPEYTFVLDRATYDSVAYRLNSLTRLPDDPTLVNYAIFELGSHPDGLYTVTMAVEQKYLDADPELNAWTAMNCFAQLQVHYTGLDPVHHYRIAMRSFATQGYSVDAAGNPISPEHDVSSAAPYANWQMSRESVYVDYSDFFTVSNFIQLGGLIIQDPDGAVSGNYIDSATGVGGSVLVRINETGSTAVLQEQVIRPSADGAQPMYDLRFDNLEQGKTYELRFYAVRYTDRVGSVNYVAEQLLPIKRGAEQVLYLSETIGRAGVSASLQLKDLSFSLQDATGAALGESLATMNRIDASKGTLNEYLNSSGTNSKDASFWVTDYIEVRPGEILQWGNQNLTLDRYNRFMFYDADKKPLPTHGTTSGNAYCYTWLKAANTLYGNENSYSLISVPKGAAYIRLSCVFRTNQSPERAAACAMATAQLFSLDDLGVRRDMLGDPLSPMSGSTAYNRQYINPTTLERETKSDRAISAAYSVRGGQTYVAMGGYHNNTQHSSAEALVAFYRNGEDKPFQTLTYYSGQPFTAPAGADSMRFVNYLTTIVPGQDSNADRYQVTPYAFNSAYLGATSLLTEGDGTGAGGYVIQLAVDITDPQTAVDPDTGERIPALQTPAGGQLETNATSFELVWYSAPGDDGVELIDENIFHTETVTGTLSEAGNTAYSATLQRQLDDYTSYAVSMYITMHGQRLLVDTAQFITQRTVMTLSCPADLHKLSVYPNGQFTMTDDIDAGSIKVSVDFGGSINGNGHKLTFRDVNFFSTTLGTAVFENMIFDWQYDLDKVVTDSNYRSGFIYINYGTIRNFVMRINVQNAEYNAHGWGGITRQNYGIVEDFAVVYDRSFSWRAEWGGVCYVNQNGGVVRNGYAYAGTGVQLDFGSNFAYGNSDNVVFYNGMLVGYAYAGSTMENVYTYAVEPIQVEKQNSFADNNSYKNTNAMLAGLMSGRTENALAIGDVKQYEVLPDATRVYSAAPIGWPSFGSFTAANVPNTYYVSLDKTLQYGAGDLTLNQSATSVPLGSLQDEGFMIDLLGEGHFMVSTFLAGGMLPKIDMGLDSLMVAQPIMYLPTGSTSSAPYLLAPTIVDQNKEEGWMDVVFPVTNNPYRCQITDVQIEGLDVTILDNADPNQITLRLNVSRGGNYRSVYDLTRYSYRSPGSNRPISVPCENKTVELEFWQPIRTARELYTIFNTTAKSESNPTGTDWYGNYLIVADIDCAQENIEQALARTNTFNGKLAGYVKDYDGTGEERAPVLKNLAPLRGYFFYNGTNASMFDLTVENLVIDPASRTQDYAGIFRVAYTGDFHDLNFVNSTVRNVGRNAGTLAGYMGSNTNVVDCTWRGVSASTINAGTGNGVRLGAVTGELSDSFIRNSYVVDLAIDAQLQFAAVNNGIGGMAGWGGGSTSTVENCYVRGSIDSLYGNVGGLVGKGILRCLSCWTYVDISSSLNSLGGIMGEYTSTPQTVYNAITFGNLNTKVGDTVGVGRIYGNYHTKPGLSRAYGYADQMIVGVSDPAAELNSSGTLNYGQLFGANAYATWYRTIGIGDYWIITGDDSPSNGKGQLPKLLSSDGVTLLPGQTEHLVAQRSLRVASTTLVDRVGPRYVVQSVLTRGAGSSFYVTDVQLDGVNSAGRSLDFTALNGTAYNPNDWRDTADGAEQTQGLRFTFNMSQFTQFVGAYPLSITLRNAEGEEAVVHGNLLLDTDNQPYLEIDSAEDWVAAFHPKQDGKPYQGLRDSYQNVRISGTVDFLSPSFLLKYPEFDPNDARYDPAFIFECMNVSAGRVTGSNNATVCNLTLEDSATITDGNLMTSLFKEVASHIDNITFRNITLDFPNLRVATTNLGYGVLARVRGDAIDLSFEKISLDITYTGNVGCIGRMEGNMTGVRASEVNIDTWNERYTWYSCYTGILAGYARGTVSNCHVGAPELDENGDALTTEMADAWCAEHGHYNNLTVGSFSGGLFGNCMNYIVVSECSVDYLHTLSTRSDIHTYGIGFGYSTANDVTVGHTPTVRQEATANAAASTGYADTLFYPVYLENANSTSITAGLIYHGSVTRGTVSGLRIKAQAGRALGGSFYANSSFVTVQDSYIEGLAAAGCNQQGNMSDSKVINTVVSGYVSAAGGALYYTTRAQVLGSRIFNPVSAADRATSAGGVHNYWTGLTPQIYYSSAIDCFIGGPYTDFAGGICGTGTPNSNSSTDIPSGLNDYYYQNFNQHCTVEGRSAGGIAGYVAGGVYSFNYSSDTTVRGVNAAGGFAGTALSYGAASSDDYRHTRISTFWFTGSIELTGAEGIDPDGSMVKRSKTGGLIAGREITPLAEAGLNAGGMFGYYAPGENWQDPQSIVEKPYYDDVVPVKFNEDYAKASDPTNTRRAIAYARIVLAPESIITSSTTANLHLVANHERYLHHDYAADPLAAGSMERLYVYADTKMRRGTGAAQEEERFARELNELVPKGNGATMMGAQLIEGAGAPPEVEAPRLDDYNFWYNLLYTISDAGRWSHSNLRSYLHYAWLQETNPDGKLDFMPYLRQGTSNKALDYQNGVELDRATDKPIYANPCAVYDASVPYGGSDPAHANKKGWPMPQDDSAPTVYLGSAEIPLWHGFGTQATGLGFGGAETAPTVLAYAAGAGVLNLEFSNGVIPFNDPTFAGSTWFTLTDASGNAVAVSDEDGLLYPIEFAPDADSEELATGYAIDRRVYSFGWDYATPLTVTTWAEEWTEEGLAGYQTHSYTLEPEALARRTAVWGDSYGYIGSTGAVTVGAVGGQSLQSIAPAEGESFVNLWNGAALTDTGAIVTLADGSVQTAAVPAGTLQVQTGTVPLDVSRYGDYQLATYGGFTVSTGPEGSYTLDRLMYSRGNALLTHHIFPGTTANSMIVDAYTDQLAYFVMLDGSISRIASYASAITLPQGFVNGAVAQINNNFAASSRNHVLIGAKQDGSVFAFNYITGEAVPLGNDAAATVDPLTYVLTNFKARLLASDMTGQANAYNTATALAGDLDLYLIENPDALGDTGSAGPVGEGKPEADGDWVQESIGETDGNGKPTEGTGEEAGNPQGGSEAAAGDTASGKPAEGAGDEAGKPQGGSEAPAGDTANGKPAEGTAEGSGTGTGAEGEAAGREHGEGETGGTSTEAGAVDNGSSTGAAAENGTPNAGADGDEAAEGDTETAENGADDDSPIGPAVDGKPAEGNGEGTGSTGIPASGSAAGSEEGAAEGLVTVYDPDSSSYRVYTAKDLLTQSDLELETVTRRLQANGHELDAIRTDVPVPTDAQKLGTETILLLSVAALALLAMLVSLRARKRRQ